MFVVYFLVGLLKIVIVLFSGNGCLFFGWFIKDCYCSFQWKWMFFWLVY